MATPSTVPLPITVSKLQAAEILQVSQDSVDRWVAQGRLQRLPGLRHVRITLPSLSRFTGLSVETIQFAVSSTRAEFEGGQR